MFERIIGNKRILENLKTAIEQGNVSHSYLFIGIEGIGKKIIAKEFSKKLLCMKEIECQNTCKSCIEFESENHPDFKIIEPDGNSIKIEQIREMQKTIQEKPITSSKKIYIINNSEKMTKEAQNCLLKTLEEPPEYAIIILIGSNESLFLDTIKSRCIIIHFEPLQNNEVKEYLEKNYELQNIDENSLNIFQGSIGKAIELKDKIEQYTSIEQIIKKLNQKSLIDIINMSQILYSSKEEIYPILEYINVILLKLAMENYKYTNCIKIVESTKERLKNNANYDMCIDNLLFNMWREIN